MEEEQQERMHIWQVIVWCGAGSNERPPDHLLAVLAEEGALVEEVVCEALKRIQLAVGTEGSVGSVYVEVINAVIKGHWAFDHRTLQTFLAKELLGGTRG